MAGLIDSSLDELEADLRELKREASRLEGYIRELGGSGDDRADAKERARSRSFSSPSAIRRTRRDGGVSVHRRQRVLSLGRRRQGQTSR